MHTQVKAVPDGMHTVTPHLVCSNADKAIEFYCRAFDAVELMRVPGPEGKLIHACIRIGDSLIMLLDEHPQWGCLGPLALKGSPVTIHLQVEYVDRVDRASGSGRCKNHHAGCGYVLGGSLRPH